MKVFKFFRGYNPTRYHQTILPTGHRLARVEDERKRIAVFCPSSDSFIDFQQQQRRMCGLRERTGFLNVRLFMLCDDVYYWVEQPDDVNGHTFTHYYHDFDNFREQWVLTTIDYLIHTFNVVPYVEPSRINVR